MRRTYARLHVMCACDDSNPIVKGVTILSVFVACSGRFVRVRGKSARTVLSVSVPLTSITREILIVSENTDLYAYLDVRECLKLISIAPLTLGAS